MNTDMLMVGFSAENINPPEGMPLVGYPKKRPNTGVGLDVKARAMVLGASADAPAAAIVVLDSLGASREVVADIRRSAVAALPGLQENAVMVAATHTHSAPSLKTFGSLGDEKAPACDSEYAASVASSATQAIVKAWAARAPRRLKIAMTNCDLHFNRRVTGETGETENVWRYEPGKTEGDVDPRFRLIGFYDEADTLQAVIGSLGCHPVTMGPGNFKVHADYPGVFMRTIEAAGLEGLFITSPAAEANPKNCLLETPDAAESMGRALAETALATLPEAKPITPTPIASASVEWIISLSDDAKQNFSNRAEASEDGKTLATEVQAIRIGELAMVSAPGELFFQLGQGVEKASPAALTLVANCANDYLGYIFTDQAKVDGGYEPTNPLCDAFEAPFLDAAKQVVDAVFE